MRHVFSHAGQGCKTFLNFCSLKVGLSHEIGSEALVVLQCANPPEIIQCYETCIFLVLLL